MKYETSDDWHLICPSCGHVIPFEFVRPVVRRVESRWRRMAKWMMGSMTYRMARRKDEDDETNVPEVKRHP